VKIGEPVIITVECENKGASPGFHTVTLKIDGMVDDEETLALNPGEVTTVGFEVSADREGTYVVDVNGLIGSFSVEKAQTGIPGFPYESAFFGLIIGTFLYWLRARSWARQGVTKFLELTFSCIHTRI
jgi:hypothetical protein